MSTTVSRRAAIMGAAAAAVALPALASPVRDPILDAIDAYRRGCAAYDAHSICRMLDYTEEYHDQAVAETYGPALEVLDNWDRPAVTLEGAIAALTLALEDEGESFKDQMIDAALAYLERLA